MSHYILNDTDIVFILNTISWVSHFQVNFDLYLYILIVRLGSSETRTRCCSHPEVNLLRLPGSLESEQIAEQAAAI